MAARRHILVPSPRKTKVYCGRMAEDVDWVTVETLQTLPNYMIDYSYTGVTKICRMCLKARSVDKEPGQKY